VNPNGRSGAHEVERVALPVLRVVLHEPQIPNNTGNIGRTCVATGCALHLVRPLGFDTSEKACRRAGLDYWPRLGVRAHDSFDAYLAADCPPRVWVLSTKAHRSVFDARFSLGDALVFGKETQGLPDELLARYRDHAIALPMMARERSLNVATAVCAVVYEAIRQLLDSKGLVLGPDFRLQRPS
jgi:tRNA (cytidine/uridine-2'-O-)-methyltransferase